VAHFADLARMLDDEGLRRTAMSVIPDPARNPMSPDPGVQRAGVDWLREMVDRAQALGAEVLGGPFTHPIGVFTGAPPTDAEWAALVAGQQAMADHAGPGLTIAIEPISRFECAALNTCAQAAALVAQVGRANYGYMIDTFHANIEERDIPAAVAATAGVLVHTHLSENDRGTPGRGHIDWAGLFAVLRQADYRGWLTFETFGLFGPDLAAATRTWRPLIGSEAEVIAESIALVRRHWPQQGVDR
jgi:D-psicose/D-tagatose/L-ribulose 3-epimerase